MVEKDVAASPSTTHILDEVALMHTPFELRKARLSCFITELQDLIEGHLVDEHLIAKLRDAHEEALDTLQDLEHDEE